MSLRFIVGPSGSGKTGFITREMVDMASSHPEKRFFCIVPDQFTMEMQKAMVLGTPGRAILNIEVLSFGRLSHRIFEELGTGSERMLDDTGKNLIIQRICLEHRDELLVLGKRAASPAVIHEIKSAVSEFMQYSVSDERIDVLIDAAEKNSRRALAMKLKDLKRIYGWFLEETEGRFTTVEGKMGLLKQAVPKSGLLKNAVVVFDGFTGFTPIQLEVIKELMLCCSSVTFTLTGEKEAMEAPYQPQELFALSKKTMASIRRCAAEAEVLEEDTVWFFDTLRYASPALKNLEHNLFRRSGTSPDKTGIELFCCPSYRDEIKYLGRKILSLVRTEDYAYRDIAVICGDMELYKDEIEREFALRRIPCFADSPAHILMNPLTEFIMNALSVIDSDFYPSNVRAFLKSAFCPLEADEADMLEGFILDKGIRGRSRWYSPYFARDPERDPERFERMEALRERLAGSLRSLSGKKDSVAGFISMVRAFLDDNGIEDKLPLMAEDLRLSGRKDKADELERVCGYILEVFETMEELTDDRRTDLKTFTELFASALSEIRIGTIPRQEDRVLVGDLERTRLSEIKVLFFIGVNDGNIPRGVNKGGIISDLDRQLLADAAPDVTLAPTPRELMYRQRLYLYMNVTKPSECLYVGYPAFDMSGKQKLPSYFIQTLQSCFLGLEIRLENNDPDGYMELSDGMDLLAGGLRDYAKGLIPEDKKAQRVLPALYDMGKSDERYANLVSSMEDGAFYTVRNITLDPALTSALYGREIKGSVSGLQTFAACHYRYFLRYGLGLREWGEYEVSDRLRGTLVHEILSRFGEKLKEEGILWQELSEPRREEIFSEVVSTVMQDPVFEPYLVTGRNRYISGFMARVARHSVNVLTAQLSAGKFLPAAFEEEVVFSVPLSGGRRMRMKEIIDRIDVYQNKDTGPFVKIIDYKTGNEKFSFSDTAVGIKLQLPVYMHSTLKKMGANTVPGAMFYYHAADPMVDVAQEMSDEEILEKRRSMLMPSGIVSSDSRILKALDEAALAGEKSSCIPSDENRIDTEDMAKICDYSAKLCVRLGEEILSGDISAMPYKAERASEDPCGYCPYIRTCRAGTVLPMEVRKRPEIKRAEDLIAYIDGLKKEKP